MDDIYIRLCCETTETTETTQNARQNAMTHARKIRTQDKTNVMTNKESNVRVH